LKVATNISIDAANRAWLERTAEANGLGLSTFTNLLVTHARKGLDWKAPLIALQGHKPRPALNAR
jgi:hypothetical protein